MLTYSFEGKGSESLYTHLYNCIKNDVLSGVLAAGYKLPSKRTFAKNLGISTITVENAYAQLIAEGFIYSIPKKGYFVSDIDVTRSVKSASAPMKTAENPQFFADLVSNSTLHTLFPFSVWAKLMRDVISHKSQSLMTKPPCGGIYELREQIAEHLRQFRAVEVDPSRIIVGAGTEYLYGLIIQLVGRGKIYAAEEPGYKKIGKIYRSNGVKICHVPIDGAGLDAQKLRESGADVVHISPSHHFPTGIVMPISRRYELLSWAAQKDGRYIIEDDYDSEFRMVGKPVPSLKSIDAADAVIYMNTFTKSLAPTIRISYMVLPEPLAERFYRELGFYSCTVSNFEQYTLAEFIGGGYMENHINRMRRHYKNVRDTLLYEIRKNPTLKSAKILEEDAGLHFLLKLDTRLTDEELKAAIRREGINISCLSDYYSDAAQAEKNTLIINYSSILPDDARAVAVRLANAVSKKVKM